MTKPSFDWAWVSRELAASGCKMGSPTNDAIVYLLRELTDHDLTPQEIDFAVTSFGSLVRGHALPRPNEELETWKPCVAGDYRIGDTVRVRASAYQGQTGMWHNGRRGRVLGTRNNSVIVCYDGENSEEARHHNTDTLEVLVT